MATKKRGTKTPGKKRSTKSSKRAQSGKEGGDIRAAEVTPTAQSVLTRVQDDAFRRAARTRASGTNLYINREVLKRDQVINAQHQRIPIKQDTLMVFADDAPLYNWAHPCRYLLYKADTGELYDEIPASFPPYLVNTPSTFQLYHEQVRVITDRVAWRVRPELCCIYRIPTYNRYAVLFSGASNNRHTNDLEFLYRSLIDKYHFNPKNIYVLNYDGTINYSGSPHPVTAWPGDNTPYRMPVNGRGTKADLEAVINDLKARLKSSDFLLIHTNNHGGYSNNEAYLCTFTGPGYTATDFANKLGELPKFGCLMVMMEQCHSGGFNAPILAKSTAMRTSVASACIATANSIGGPQFDPFARDWISAVNGSTPYGAALAFNPDSNSDGRVSAVEAFDYANAIHDPYDTPVFSEANGGGGCYLSNKWGFPWWWPLLVEAIDPYWRRPGPDPGPEFYRRIREELLPRLDRADIEVQFDKRVGELQRDLSGRIAEIVKQAMG